MQIPEQGQLVTVRQRQYIISEINKSTLQKDIKQPLSRPQHLITLQSIEEDAMGEELQVIWELEPGAKIFDRVPLPEPEDFDEPEKLEAFLNAVRWGAISSADKRALQSPFRSGIVIEDYQLDPLVRAIQMPRVNLLIADDVGMGKTIEAGLIIQELILRHRARTVLIVCPSALQIQWKDQMRDKFGLEFRIVDSELQKELRRKRGIHANPWTHFPRLITSIDYIKRDRPMRLMREVLPAAGESAYPRRFDILLIDEAHGVSPSGKGKYATDSQRTQAIRTIVPHFENRLFLTATPHNGYKESFSALLELLDNQRFARGVNPPKDRLGEIMIRRLKSELPPLSDGTPRFPERKIEPVEVIYTDKEKELHKLLESYKKLRLRNHQNKTEEVATKFVLITLKKRLFSSPEAFRITLEKHINSLKTAKKRKTGTFQKPSYRILQHQIESLEEEFANDEIYEESYEETIEESTLLFRESTDEEENLLENMKKLSEDLVKRPDSKTAELIKWLNENIRPEGKWSDERVIIFTEYRATQKWLLGLLAVEKLTEDNRLMILYGGMDLKEREKIKAAFQANPKESSVRILLATDAASEGIDLQNHCARLIHYEIPWNPNRMEQRNGRVDRHGQRGIRDKDGKKYVYVYHFVSKGFREKHSASGNMEDDLEFLMRAVNKIQNIREDLGKVGPIIAKKVEQAMLTGNFDLETQVEEKDAKSLRKILSIERNIQEQIQKLMARLAESKETLNLSPEHIEAVVHTGLALAGQSSLIPCTLPGINGKRVFRLPSLKGSWSKSFDGLAHPHTGTIRPVTFDEEAARGRDDVVLAHLNHNLVQQCLRLLRAEVWAAERKKLNRVTCRSVSKEALEEPAVIAHARLVIIGGDCQRLHEEIITAGGFLRKGRFARLNVGQIDRALKSADNNSPAEPVKQKLLEEWPLYAEPLKRSLEVRMEERKNGLYNTLKDRENKEVEDITKILEELGKAISMELKEAEKPSEQIIMEGFGHEEKEQYRQDINALRNRLQEIPGEIEREVEHIKKRFMNTQARIFPVALTFLVPEVETICQ